AVPAGGGRDRGAAGGRARGTAPVRVGGALVPERGRSARAADRHGALAAQPRPHAAARTARAVWEREGEGDVKPMDLAKELRQDAAFDPAALDRGKAVLMAAIREELAPRRKPTFVPQLPYNDIRAALAFLERAFGFREIPTSRVTTPNGAVAHAMM